LTRTLVHRAGVYLEVQRDGKKSFRFLIIVRSLLIGSVAVCRVFCTASNSAELYDVDSNDRLEVGRERSAVQKNIDPRRVGRNLKPVSDFRRLCKLYPMIRLRSQNWIWSSASVSITQKLQSLRPAN